MTTELVLYGEDETPRQQRFIQQYFSADHLTNEEYLDFQVLATKYTGGETVNVKRYLSSYKADGTPVDQTIWVWGIFCYPKERTNIETGEVETKPGIIFRLGTQAEPSEMFLSFESSAMTNFVKRSILPMINRGILAVGDWSIGIPLRVWEVPAKVGNSYRVRLLSPKEI